MESLNEQQGITIDEELSEPRFDEEATLLSARPVVPLTEVKAEARLRGRLVIALAVVGALIMGAVAGTLLFKGRGQSPDTEMAETTDAAPLPAQMQAGASGAVAETEETPVAENIEIPSSETQNSMPEADPPSMSPPKSSRPIVLPRREDVADDKEARRLERKEARRLRRQAERDARQSAKSDRRQSTDDLTRIREIFEGSPRP